MKIIARKLNSNIMWPSATYVNTEGEKYNLMVVSDTVPTPSSYQEFQTSDLEVVVNELGLTSLKPTPSPRPNPIIPPISKKVNKFDLIEKLVAFNVAEKFFTLINNLPIAERLKWDAAQNISKDYPFLTENKETIMSTLGITSEQFDQLFE